MNVPFDTKADDTVESKFIEASQNAGLLNLKGHRSVGGMQASIYNAITQQEVDTLIEFMRESLKGRRREYESRTLENLEKRLMRLINRFWNANTDLRADCAIRVAEVATRDGKVWPGVCITAEREAQVLNTRRSWSEIKVHRVKEEVARIFREIMTGLFGARTPLGGSISLTYGHIHNTAPSRSAVDTRPADQTDSDGLSRRIVVIWITVLFPLLKTV